MGDGVKCRDRCIIFLHTGQKRIPGESRGTNSRIFYIITYASLLYMFVYISRHFLEAMFSPPRKLALLHILFPGLTPFYPLIVNLGADFEYDLKRIIALRTSRQLGVMVGAVNLRVPVLRYATSFSKLSFITILHKYVFSCRP